MLTRHAVTAFLLVVAGLKLGVSSGAGAGGDGDVRADPEGTAVGVGGERRVHGATSSPKRSDAHWAGISRRAIAAHDLHKPLSLTRKYSTLLTCPSMLSQAKLSLY